MPLSAQPCNSICKKILGLLIPYQQAKLSEMILGRSLTLYQSFRQILFSLW